MRTRLPLVILLSFLPRQLAAQTADEIVKKAVDARGGMDKIKTVQSERITGHLSSPQGVEAAVVLELQRPHKLHSEVTVEGQKIIRVYDGKSAGWTINPFAENKDVQPMSAEDLREISEESDLDGPLVDYQSKGTQIGLIGKEELDGKPVYRLKLTNKNGAVRSYLLDATSFLTLKWEGIRKIGDKELPWESSLSDYREIQGLKYPFKIDQDSPGTEIKQTFTVERIEINPQIDEAHFAKPALPEAPTHPSPPGPQAD